MRRPPITLWLAAFRDLARLAALTTGVLVIVTAIGAVFQPLSAGLLRAADVVTFVAFACVPMLAYALPFAAGFASTLTYHRIAADNEALAAHAGGISHRAILAPALAMGLLLAGTLLLLNEEVIPRFLERMQRMITVDVSNILVQEIERGKAATVGRSIIFADRAERVRPEPGSGVLQQVEFRGFAVLQLDATDNPAQELTAARATMFLMPAVEPAPDAGSDSAQSLAIVQLEDALGADAQGIVGVRQDTTLVFRVPNVFRDKPKFLTGTRLRALRTRPENLNWIDARRRALASTMAADALLEEIERSLSEQQLVALTDPASGPVTIRASGIDRVGDTLRFRPVSPLSAVDVAYARPGSNGPVPMRALAQDAALVIPAQANPSGTTLAHLELRDVRTAESSPDQDFSRVPDRSLLVLPDLRPARDTGAAFRSRSSIELIESPQAPDASQATNDARVALEKAVREVRLDVLAKVHERASMAASCLVMVLTGAVTALRFSARMPLTIYLWTFLPALACIATISGGQQLARQSGTPGLLLLWSGVGALLIYTLIMYRSLARH
jgi:lipopolysaccharide export LptBFGC system permease protein LptF